MRGAAVAGVLIVVILAGAGAGYLYGSGGERTVTSVSTGVGPTTTLVASTTLTLTTTLVYQRNSTATLVRTNTTTVVLPPSGWNGLILMNNESNCGVSTAPPTIWYETPCFGTGTDAVVFNCAAEAASQQGCTLRVNTNGLGTPQPAGPAYFVVTVWYPYVNATLNPGVNCRYSVPSVPTPPGPQGPYNAYCISVNATSFLVAEQAPQALPPP